MRTNSRLFSKHDIVDISNGDAFVVGVAFFWGEACRYVAGHDGIKKSTDSRNINKSSSIETDAIVSFE